MSVDEAVDLPQVAVPAADNRGWAKRRLADVVGVLTDPQFRTWVRWWAVAVWGVAFAHTCYYEGIPFDREGLLLWLVAGAAAITFGKRALWTVAVDWLPFAAVLVAYDYARGAADSLGMPTWWTPQITVDKALFGGVEPTVWLQEHFRYATARWWDAAVCLIYISFFFLPYVTAAVLWVRSRRDFRRWAARFVTLSFLGFGLFALFPAAPPWAAAQCTPAQVAGHPSAPACLFGRPAFVPNGGLLGPVRHVRAGAHPWLERLSARGWSMLHLREAGMLLHKGQGTVDVVAAVPSLHAGGTMLFALFMWRRVRVWWRAVLVAYVLAMAVALVYAAEHYAADILAGWLLAALVMWGFARLESRRSRAAPPDTLSTDPAASMLESLCPPIATTPSSI